MTLPIHKLFVLAVCGSNLKPMTKRELSLKTRAVMGFKDIDEERIILSAIDDLVAIGYLCKFKDQYEATEEGHQIFKSTKTLLYRLPTWEI